jgi:Ras homolog gene family, member A
VKTIEELARTKQKPVLREQGQKVSKEIGAYKYIECSAVTNEGIREVFETATRAALLVKPREKRRLFAFRSRAKTQVHS